MSLLSIDVSKVKRLSLREIKLTAPELSREPIEAIQESQTEAPKETTIKALQSPEIEKLKGLANKVVEPFRGFYSEEIKVQIMKATNVSQERAEIGCTLMLQAGAIEQAINPEIYYLGGSTPF